MKKIEAIIREERMEAVKIALEDSGFIGLTVSHVSGRGKQKGISLQWRAGEYRVDFLPKVKIEIVCDDGEEDLVVDTIRKAAETGKIGDGRIFVLPVEQAIRIRTGEKDKSVV
ncbi:MAG: P-II family nitrogen regulator [Chloroflexota bacterium]